LEFANAYHILPQQAVFGKHLPAITTDRLRSDSSELVADVGFRKLTNNDTQALEVFGNGTELVFAFDSKDDKAGVFCDGVEDLSAQFHTDVAGLNYLLCVTQILADKSIDIAMLFFYLMKHIKNLLYC
jgi:hypothetical protein